MGRDKALVEVDGVPLARRVADALEGAGCGEVLAVGGDAGALEALGLEVVPDRWPGEGPLGGLATAVGAAWDRAARQRPGGDPPEPVVDPAEPVVVVVPCDLLSPSRAVAARLVAALDGTPGAAVAVPVAEGRREWVHAAWRASAGLAEALEALLASGARRLDAVAGVVGTVVEVPVRPASLADADEPGDLPPRSASSGR